MAKYVSLKEDIEEHKIKDIESISGYEEFTLINPHIIPHHVLYLDDYELDLIVELLEQLIIETELQHEGQVKKKEEMGDIPNIDYPDAHFEAENILSKIEGVEYYEADSLIIKERVEPVKITKEENILVNMTPSIYERGYIPFHGKAKYYLPRYTRFDFETAKGNLYSVFENFPNYVSISKWGELVKELDIKEKDILEIKAIEPLKFHIKKSTEPLQPPIDITPSILKHKLKTSEVNSKHFVAEIRDFLRKFRLIPQKEITDGRFDFNIYDNNRKPYGAYLDKYTDRIFSTEWHNHFELKVGDNIIVNVEPNLIMVYPDSKC